MKKTYFWQTALMAGALLFGFTACSNDDNDAQQQNNNEERTLTLTLNTGAAASSMRATTITEAGAATKVKENKIQSVFVGIYNNTTGALISGDVYNSSHMVNGGSGWDASGETATGNADVIKITIATQGLSESFDVFAVANPSTTVGTALKAATTLTAAKAVPVGMGDMLEDTTTPGQEKEEYLYMIGDGALTTSDSKNFTAAIDLYHLSAKVSLENLTINLGAPYAAAGGSFTLDEVYLDNVPAKQETWYTPHAKNESETYTDGGTYLTTGTGANASTKYVFYTMPNAATEKKYATRLVLKGNFKTSSSDATGTTVYYPIYLDYDPSTEAVPTGASLPDYASKISLTAREAKVVYPNDWYQITATIKSVGVTDPTQDLDPQSVVVTVTAKDFLDIAQTATFE